MQLKLTAKSELYYWICALFLFSMKSNYGKWFYFLAKLQNVNVKINIWLLIKFIFLHTFSAHAFLFYYELFFNFLIRLYIEIVF